MADTPKILGQSSPAATTETDLYEVPALTSAVVSSLTICNQNGTGTTVRVSVSAGGGATAAKDYIFYDLPIEGPDTFVATIGITLATTDVMRVYADDTNVAFNLFGVEKT